MRPILEYASTVWDGCHENDKHTLLKCNTKQRVLPQDLLVRKSKERVLREIGSVSV
jgi:hypothetical protein